MRWGYGQDANSRSSGSGKEIAFGGVGASERDREAIPWWLLLLCIISRVREDSTAGAEAAQTPLSSCGPRRDAPFGRGGGSGACGPHQKESRRGRPFLSLFFFFRIIIIIIKIKESNFWKTTIAVDQ